MIKAIVAIDDNFGIGKDGTLPWPHNKRDMTHFKEQTTGHVVVMGSKTWADEKMPKPLPNRVNAVITRNPDNVPAGADRYITEEVPDCIVDLQADFPDKDIWVIGGANLFKQTMGVVEELYITRIVGDYGCDTKLDESFLKGFQLQSVHGYTDSMCAFEVWKRK